MATVEIIEGTGGRLTLFPDSIPLLCTVELFKPSSSEPYVTGSATLPGFSSTIVDIQTSPVGGLELGTVTGLDVGDMLMLTAFEAKEAMRVVAIDVATTAIVVENMPSKISVGDAVNGTKLEFQVLPDNATPRGLNYRIEWLVRDSDNIFRKYQTMYHIVRTQFRDAVTPEDVQRFIAARFPSMASDSFPGHIAEIARRASDRVKRQVQAAGTYPHLVGDADAFVDCGVTALRLELSHEGLIPSGFDANDYLYATERALKAEIADALGALQWYDEDDSGTVDDSEILRTYHIKARRV